MKALSIFLQMIGVLFCLCHLFQLFYFMIGLFPHKQEEKKHPVLHRHAILICARNEEKVIGDLLDSIHHQTYPQELLQPFVMADNCNDDTAAIALSHGAIVYSRHNEQEIGKGYALEALLKHIHEDHPQEYDGYFVFDADNILKEDFIEKMNERYSEGRQIITSYRNSKNFGHNWISAGSALCFLKDCRFLNGPRDLLGSSCKITGTGFFFSERIRQEMQGWPYHLLTEDLEFTLDQTIKGHKIAYCPEAVIYDEQPVDLMQSCRQRIRWAKGYLQVFGNYTLKLIKGMFQGSFCCFDLFCNGVAAYVPLFASVLCRFLMILLSIGDKSLFLDIVHATMYDILKAYIFLCVMSFITTIAEWKQIYCSTIKKLLYVFSYPVFMFTYFPVSVIAFFSKPEWKPIRHDFRVKDMHMGRDY